MIITNEARELLREMFREQEVNNVRIYFAGYG